MGKITVIGIGPGSLEDMTPRALKAIQQAQVVAGYNTYIRLIEELLSEKEVIGTAMMQEIDRCRMAVDAAAAGKDTVVVSSGDSGVYGMIPSLNSKKFIGTVNEISWVSSDMSVSNPSYYSVEITVPNPSLELKPGFKAVVRFKGSR